MIIFSQLISRGESRSGLFVRQTLTAIFEIVKISNLQKKTVQHADFYFTLHSNHSQLLIPEILRWSHTGGF